ncbi:MAG TPA: hypothetical protein VLQ20_11550, partial [Planococcus sp. (in: firmicutes)]|nr:hypothetical protein [Planococcus sp. (in: firmicutes)]
GVSPSEDARFALICTRLISKFCAGRFARPLLFVDVLLFSFQGSCCAPLIGDLINIPRPIRCVNTL